MWAWILPVTQNRMEPDAHEHTCTSSSWKAEGIIWLPVVVHCHKPHSCFWWPLLMLTHISVSYGHQAWPVSCLSKESKDRRNGSCSNPCHCILFQCSELRQDFCLALIPMWRGKTRAVGHKYYSMLDDTQIWEYFLCTKGLNYKLIIDVYIL